MRTVAVEEHYCSEAAALEVPAIQHSLSATAVTGANELLLDVGTDRIRHMDAAGIDVQVLSFLTPAAQEQPPDDAVRRSRQENDHLADIVRSGRSRFGAFAMLPTPAPKEAAAELRRCVGDLGFSGAMIHGHTGGRYLDDEFFWPIFEAAAEVERPIYLHPTYPPQAVVDTYYQPVLGSKRIAGRLATSAWGWHADTGMHALRLIAAGVFDRYPTLQIVLGHMGEHIPYSLFRADERLNEVCDHLKRRVADYFCENFYVTTSGYFAEAPLQCALSILGADRIMFAVDYPYSSSEEACGWFEGIALSPSDRRKIAFENADRLLGLGPKGGAVLEAPHAFEVLS